MDPNRTLNRNNEDFYKQVALKNGTAVDFPPFMEFLHFPPVKNKSNNIYLVRMVVSSLIPVWWENAGDYIWLRGEFGII